MKTFNIIGWNRSSVEAMKATVKRLGLKYKKRNPDMIISLGGDGTFLSSERKFPKVPKLLIRDSDICQKCANLEFDEIFMKIILKNYVLMKYLKLEAIYKSKKYLATNDIVVRNQVPLYALRFEVTINNKKKPCMIGDGIVLSTVFGATGYHYSITKKKFTKGIGLAFNNLTENVAHKILPDNSVVKLKLIRHDADFCIDNDPKIMKMKEGETVTIKGSRKFAQIIKVI